MIKKKHADTQSANFQDAKTNSLLAFRLKDRMSVLDLVALLREFRKFGA